MPTKVITAIQTGFRRLKEPNSYSVSYHTQEIDRETAMDIADFTGQLVKVVISDSNIQKEIIESVEAVDIREKEKWSPSQKLRFAIRELQTRQGLDDQEPEEYYREWISKFIEHINKIK
ncbi:hypothetical protein EP331_00325 [bacterium]|nr:MAG: hypothetical protein EP331_00325 [bacterium]